MCILLLICTLMLSSCCTPREIKVYVKFKNADPRLQLYDYDFKEENNNYDFSNYTTKELYDKALEIDPSMNIHQNNRQRLERFISYYLNNKNDYK